MRILAVDASTPECDIAMISNEIVTRTNNCFSLTSRRYFWCVAITSRKLLLKTVFTHEKYFCTLKFFSFLIFSNEARVGDRKSSQLKI